MSAAEEGPGADAVPDEVTAGMGGVGNNGPA